MEAQGGCLRACWGPTYVLSPNPSLPQEDDLRPWWAELGRPPDQPRIWSAFEHTTALWKHYFMCVFVCVCAVTCEGGDSRGRWGALGCGLPVCLVLKWGHLHPGLSSAVPAVLFVGSGWALVVRHPPGGHPSRPQCWQARGAAGAEAVKSHEESTMPACHIMPPPLPGLPQLFLRNGLPLPLSFLVTGPQVPQKHSTLAKAATDTAVPRSWWLGLGLSSGEALTLRYLECGVEGPTCHPVLRVSLHFKQHLWYGRRPGSPPPLGVDKARGASA